MPSVFQKNFQKSFQSVLAWNRKWHAIWHIYMPFIYIYICFMLYIYLYILYWNRVSDIERPSEQTWDLRDTQQLLFDPLPGLPRRHLKQQYATMVCPIWQIETWTHINPMDSPVSICFNMSQCFDMLEANVRLVGCSLGKADHLAEEMRNWSELNAVRARFKAMSKGTNSNEPSTVSAHVVRA